MLSENDWVLIDKVFQTHRADLFNQVQYDKNSWAEKCNAGIFNSNIYMNGINEIEAKEKRKVGELAYQSIEQVLRAKKEVVTDVDGKVIKERLSKMIVQSSGVPAYQSADTVKKYEAQLEVLFMDINASTSPVHSSMTFNAPVGVVVSHGGTASNFDVTISGATATEVTALLDKAIGAIKGTAVDGTLSTQAQEVLGEIKTEVAQSKPNSIRLNSLILGLATTIQTVGELKPAYDFVKSAALLLGVTLP